MTRYALTCGAFEIDSLPSQCQIAVCHGFYVNPAARKQGFGHVLKTEQMEVLQHLNYNFAICTVVSSNVAQKKILERSGWEFMRKFYSERQDEHVEVWGIEL